MVKGRAYKQPRQIGSIIYALHIRPQQFHMIKSEISPAIAVEPVLSTVFPSTDFSEMLKSNVFLLQRLTLEYKVWSANKLPNIPKENRNSLTIFLLKPNFYKNYSYNWHT